MKGFAIVLDIHAGRAVKFLNVHFHPAGLRMAGDIGHRFLGHAKKHRAPGRVQLFHSRKGYQMSADPRPRGETFHEGVQGGNQPQIIQHRRAQFAGELMHDVHRFFHQPLRPGDVAVQALGVDHGLLFQGRQPDIDARQSLGDDIMQFAADFPSLLLLGRDNLAGQLPQLRLQALRLFQQLRVMALAFFERFLHRLALSDFLFQNQVGGGQLHRALAQHLDDLIQVDGGLPRAPMNCLHRGNRLGKESPRMLDERGAFAGHATWQHLGNQDLLMELGHVQRLQTGGQRLLAHAARRFQPPSRTLL